MCLFLSLLLFGPRIVIIFWWIAEPLRWSAAFDTFVLPFLGFLFLPWTTLMYVIAWSPVGGVEGAEWLLVGLGLALDIATYSARAARGKTSYY